MGMLNRFAATLLLSSLTICTAVAQKLKKADKAAINQLKEHVRYLASDQLEGRRAGTAGEQLAREYIATQFNTIGLQPKGIGATWFQEFDINDGKMIGPGTFFFINDHELKPQQDYFPLSYSAAQSVEAMVSMALNEEDVPWFWDLKDLLEENKDNPHFDLQEAIKKKAASSVEKGATALLLYTSEGDTDPLKFDPKDRSATTALPILFITATGRDKFLKNNEDILDLKIKVELKDKIRKGHNVIGLLDNGAAHTVVLGAHYDHLGYGEDGNSMLRTGEVLIHNGADDNASGTAALIELARLVKKSGDKRNNYLFLAFSAEELGLNGSKFFTEHPTIPIEQYTYMVNMDMVGRLNDSSRTVTVGGYGTSPWWGDLFRQQQGNKFLNIKFDSSGTGPSDHTSFYRKDIPVLFFFTGLHSDYHRPTDDFDKLNYPGEWSIIKYIAALLKATAEQKDKLAFTKTRETQTSTSARFSVSMGIMPDYTYTGNGVHVDGVSDGRPAQKAGILKNDVIQQLGDYPVSSVEAYMQALGKFKKGDKARVKLKRGETAMEVEVQF
jgi:hypothetical protein